MDAFAAGAGLVEVVVGSSVVLVVLELVVAGTRAARVVSVVPDAASDLPAPPSSAEEQAPSTSARARPAAVLAAIDLGPRGRVWFFITAFGPLRSVNGSTLFPLVA